METHLDHLAASGIELSEELGVLLDDYLTRQNLAFPALSDDTERIEAVQMLFSQPLTELLLQEDCSGVFILLDVTVNSRLKDADFSRSGLYLQVNGYDKDMPQNRDVVLYRGAPDVGRSLGAMPHRKWRLEFRTDQFPNYAELVSLAGTPLSQAYRFTDVTVLSGTSEQVMLLAVPVTGADGTFYGICGLEVSASYFMTFHAQPSKVDHLTCLLAPDADSLMLHGDAGLTCGTSEGYHNPLHAVLSVKDTGHGLVYLQTDQTGDAYVGMLRTIRISPNNPDYTMAVMMPKADFDRVCGHSLLKNTTLLVLFLFFAVSCCLTFVRRLISPVLRELEQLRLENEEARKQYETAQTEISRLAYSRKTEVDPDAFRQFADSLSTLTPTERRIFNHYVEGRTVKEIIAIAGIKESTLRYHNQNIYSKLGVNSLKQMLRYAALLQQENADRAEHTK